MVDTPKHSVSVAGVVVDEQSRVLAIQRRDNGHWEPPGGVLEIDETPEEGVRREVREETGLDVDVQSLSGVYKNMDKAVIALVFRCRARGTAAKTSAEAASIAWIEKAEVAKLMNEAYAIRVLDALAVGATVRAHDGTSLLENSR